ncbi:hypothetical protein FOZ60_009808 [Perkinsus olseni]|uniref:Uncharacterized protein n=1 Tax=Perkinsus olseni TaxID=32597 RepID=A0A7J6NGI3_PEROL|nr:hypothetical protein FOZ60_009808 [Perkinsus olseni]
MAEALRVAWDSAPGMTRAIVSIYVGLLICGLLLELTQTYAMFEFVELTVWNFWYRCQYWLLLTNPFFYSQNAITMLAGLPVGFYLLCRLPAVERSKGSTGLLFWFLGLVYTIVLLSFVAATVVSRIDRLFPFFWQLRHISENIKISGLFPSVVFLITKDCIMNHSGESFLLGVWPISNRWYPCVLMVIISLFTWSVRLDLVVAAGLALLNTRTGLAPMDRLEPSTETLVKVETNLLRNWFMPVSLFGGEYIPVERSVSYSSDGAGTEMSHTADDIESGGHHQAAQGDTEGNEDASLASYDVVEGPSNREDEQHIPLPVVPPPGPQESSASSNTQHDVTNSSSSSSSTNEDSMRAPLIRAHDGDVAKGAAATDP